MTKTKTAAEVFASIKAEDETEDLTRAATTAYDQLRDRVVAEDTAAVAEAPESLAQAFAKFAGISVEEAEVRINRTIDFLDPIDRPNPDDFEDPAEEDWSREDYEADRAEDAYLDRRMGF